MKSATPPASPPRQGNGGRPPTPETAPSNRMGMRRLTGTMLDLNVQLPPPRLQVEDIPKGGGSSGTPTTNRIHSGGASSSGHEYDSAGNRLSYKYSERGSLLLKRSGLRIGRQGVRDSLLSPRPSPELRELCSPRTEAASTYPGHLVKLGELGHGASGAVHKAVHASTLQLLAVKEVPVHDKGRRHQIGAEVVTLMNSKTRAQSEAGEEGSGVVAFYEAFANQCSGCVSIVMEYCSGGSLQDILSAHGQLDELTVSSVAHDALLGLQHLHAKRILHRDLKPSNLLVDGQGRVKLADFGLVRELSRGARGKDLDKDGKRDVIPGSPQTANTFVGTAIYMSPERLQGDPYSYASDVWSLGLSLLTLHLGAFPLKVPKSNLYWNLVKLLCSADAESPEPLDQFLSSVSSGDGSGSAEQENSPEVSLSGPFRDFLSKCLQRKPENRPSAEDLLGHPFVQMSPSRLGDALGIQRDQIGLDGRGTSPTAGGAARRSSLEDRITDLEYLCQQVVSFHEAKSTGGASSSPTIRSPYMADHGNMPCTMRTCFRPAAYEALASQMSLPLEVVVGCLDKHFTQVLGPEAGVLEGDEATDTPN
ncbi:unnamed protein product [Chrysoparadoxa australica]